QANMLLLAALVATAIWSGKSYLLYGFAQEIPIQSPISITKFKKTARMYCEIKNLPTSFDSTVIHWYKRKENEAPQRLLFFTEGKTSVESGLQKDRYRAERVSDQNRCVLMIKDVIPDDAGMYYCAYWDPHNVFGSGTKLIVSGNSKPENSEILQTKHKDQLLYVCLIENFYPEVIRVQWVDGADKEVTKNVVKGDVWKSTNDKYSVSTWLTLPVNMTNKNYFCKYDHESQENFKLPIQALWTHSLKGTGKAPS
uniref:Ig-like domain-containing protein n=1 Tax=Anser brachyrhynchus TaxID=132585 RepID=A0A8B9I740_9AVES